MEGEDGHWQRGEAAGRLGPFLTLEPHSGSSSLEELLIDNKQHLSTSSGDVTGGTGGLPTPQGRPGFPSSS